MTVPARGELPDRTYERLLDAIVRGRLAPGARLIEAEIALRFGISRTPVREALLRLTHEGHVVANSVHRRTELSVALLPAQGVTQLWGIIGALEGFAASVVCQLPKSVRRTVADDMKRINHELVRASARHERDPDLLFDLQTTFHGRFVRAAAAPRLLAIHDSVRPHVQRYEWAYGASHDADLSRSTEEHSEIITTMRSGTPAQAKRVVEQHWANAAVRTTRVIEHIPRDSSAS